MRAAYLDIWANLLVNYSLEVKPGQIVRLSADPVAMPLAEAVYEAIVKAGGHPHVKIVPQEWQALMLQYGSDAQLAWSSPITEQEIERIDASVALWGGPNTKYLTSASPDKLALLSQARRPQLDRLMHRAAQGELNWVGTEAPCHSAAQDAGLSLGDYERFLIKAGHLDDRDPIAYWRGIEKTQQKLASFLETVEELHFWTPQGTDIKVNVKGMRWRNSCGRRNFPDGEVFSGPNLKADNGGVQGVMQVSFPAVHMGREVDGVMLHFEQGRVVESSATKGQDFLRAAIAMDEGACYVGEIAIGTNYGIQQYMRNTLFDEKIGGTFHLALGAGYPDTGNTNKSGLHWDLVGDLRQGGWIRADGKVILENGYFLAPFDEIQNMSK